MLIFPKKNLILIGSGFLGSYLIQEFKKREFQFLNTHFSKIQDDGYYLDIRNLEEIRDLFVKYKPDIIINTAGRNDIDYLEQNPNVANSVNTIGIGTDNIHQNINIGTSGIRTITIGNNNALS